MRALLEYASQHSLHYLEGLDGRSVAPTPEAIARLETLEQEMPASSSDALETLRILDEVCSPATMAMAGRRFFGFVIGGSLPVALAANWMAGAWDQNSAFHSVTPATSELEQITLRWLLDLFGLPPGSGGAFVSGATVANFSCLAAARHAVLERLGWHVEAEGLFGAPPIQVIVGDEVHASAVKALGMLGLGRNRVVRVPADDQGRMRLDQFPAIQAPAIVCLQAGNVNTGAFDPAGVIDVAHEAGAWVHVDGAFGLWARAAPSTAGLAAGLERADSWATDMHKYLNVPYDSGMAFVRDPDALRAAMAVTAAYLPSQSPQRDPADFTPELSRRARGVEVWAALRTLGKSGVADLIERTCQHARRFADGLKEAGYEVLNQVVLNQVLVSFGSADLTKRVIAEVQADGTAWCGGTVWHGQTAMRISVSSWATQADDVEKSLAAIIQVADRCRQQESRAQR